MSVRTSSWKRTSLMAVLSLPFLYPFLFLVNTALKPNREFERDATSFTSNPTSANLASAWNDAGLGGAMLNSLIAVSIAVVFTLVVSVSAAFWFIRHEGRWSTTWRILLIATTAIPLPVYIIPLFLQLSGKGLTDNLYVMGVIYAGWNASLGLYLIHTFLKAIPSELLEAARIDGANVWQQLVYMIVPLAKPMIATVAILSFVWSWGDLLAGVVIVQDPDRRLLVPATALLNDIHLSNIPRTAAAVLIAITPMFIVFMVGQRALVRGILAGSGK